MPHSTALLKMRIHFIDQKSPMDALQFDIFPDSSLKVAHFNVLKGLF